MRRSSPTPQGGHQTRGGRTPAKSPTPEVELSASISITGSTPEGKDATLADLRRALPNAASIDPLLRLADLPRVLNCGERTVERYRAAGVLPRPDLMIGLGTRRSPRWKAETIGAWIEGGCR